MAHTLTKLARGGMDELGPCHADICKQLAPAAQMPVETISKNQLNTDILEGMQLSTSAITM